MIKRKYPQTVATVVHMHIKTLLFNIKSFYNQFLNIIPNLSTSIHGATCLLARTFKIFNIPKLIYSILYFSLTDFTTIITIVASCILVQLFFRINS